MPDQELRESALRRYIVFRVKAIEFLDLGGLHQGLLNGSVKPYPPFRTSTNMIDSLRTVQVSRLALFVDKNGLNVLELWKLIFPQHKKLVEEAWEQMEGAWPVIRGFRDSAGFHGDKPSTFFGARRKLRSEINQVTAAILEFEKIFKFFLKVEEKDLPELEETLDDLLDEQERMHGTKFKREQFKAYIMIPDTHASKIKK